MNPPANRPRRSHPRRRSTPTFDEIYSNSDGSRKDGYVYILHFRQPQNGARHYIGWTTNWKRRLVEHALGRGAEITRAANSRRNRFVPSRIISRCTVDDEARYQREITINPRLCALCDLGTQGKKDEASALAQRLLESLSSLVEEHKAKLIEQQAQRYAEGIYIDKEESYDDIVTSWWNLQTADWRDNVYDE